MFGYVVINEQELKVREVGVYRSYYCGFCRELKRKYGFTGQMTLSYDMTFLIMVLCDLYDAKDTVGETRCLAHPLGKHPTRINRFTEYAADMNLILSYYSCLDNWNDEHKVTSLALSKLIHGKEEAAAADYGYKAAVIKDRLDKLHEAETSGETNIDIPAGYFGDIMAELFAVYRDEWEEPLRQMGFYLGKFIYIMDAYDDLEKDEKSGSYNPLLLLRERMTSYNQSDRSDFSERYDKEGDTEARDDQNSETDFIEGDNGQNSETDFIEGDNDQNSEINFDDYCHQLLTMMISKASAAFETLPCVENLSIIRNILYSGVWTKYNIVRARRSAAREADSSAASEADSSMPSDSSFDGRNGGHRPEHTVKSLSNRRERRTSEYDPLDSYDAEALGAGKRS